MLASKTNRTSSVRTVSEGGTISNSNSKPKQQRSRATSAPRVSRLAAAGGAAKAAADRAHSPLHQHQHQHAAGVRLDIPAKPSPASRATTDLPALNQKQQQATARSSSSSSAAAANITKLQAQLRQVQDDLRSAREHLAATESDKAQALQELELERFKSTEREQSEEEWRRKYRELQGELAAAVETKEATLRDSANRVEVLMAEVARLRAHMDTQWAQQEWKSKAESLQLLLEQVSRTNAALEEDRQGLLETNTSLDIARKEASQLQAAIDKLRSEHEMSQQQAASNESRDRSRVACLTQDKTKLLRELDAARDERDKAKKAVEDLAAALRSAEDRHQLLLAETSRLTECLRLAEMQVQELKADKTQLLGDQDAEVLALNHQLTELRLREREKASELSKQLAEVHARLTEANLSSEEAKVSSLRLEEMLRDRERELATVALENSEMRAREAAAQAKIDELAEAMARKVNGGVAGGSPEKQPSVLLKLICSPMHNTSEESIQVEDIIKHVEVETVKHQVDDSKIIIEDDLSKDKEREDDDGNYDGSSGDDDSELVDQMNGLLIHGPTSSFNQDVHKKKKKKKKKALLRKFGSLLKKNAHFTKLTTTNHA